MASEFDTFLKDMFAPVGGVRFRRMFGGTGIFRDGLMIALVADDVLYFKADAKTIPAFEAEGCGPFVYDAKGKPVTMSYWRAPERLYDEPDAFAEWVETATSAARRADAAKSGKTRKRSRRKKIAPRANGAA